MKELNLGVKIHDQLFVSILLFADDLALIADFTFTFTFFKSLVLTEQNELYHVFCFTRYSICSVLPAIVYVLF